MNIITIALLVSVGLLAVACGVLWVTVGRVKQQAATDLAAFRQQLTAMENQLAAVLDGAVGMGDKMRNLSKEVRETRDEQLQLTQRDLGNLPFNKAAQMVEQGATAAELVSDCGLSQSEADLVVMMHRKAAAPAKSQVDSV